MQVRQRIHVSGIVQGVGFRPFVYRLAAARQLSGQIANTAAGVVIEVQGPDEAVDDFLRRLPQEAPPLALITALEVVDVSLNGDGEFRILPSEKSESVRTLIPPDIAICKDCLRELFDPRDRRYLYPFINCTNCGPRFTIVRSIPYDRPQTSMAVFPMCPRCRAEYEDPLNRRFHAQPNACWNCGPHVELWDAQGRRISTSDPIEEAASQIKSGVVVAVKGLGGFHLAADALNILAVRRLRDRKHRVEKPFAIMVPDLEAAERFCEVEAGDRDLLMRPERPIVLLPRKKGGGIPFDVAPQNKFLGVFLPYTPLHHLLFAKSQLPAIVMTSGNLSEEPIAIENCEAVKRLGSLADYFLVHDREILRRCDDSVVRRVGKRVRQLRRSRGFVPVPVFLKKRLPETLAVGGELKSTICVLKGDEAFLSQHIGDLENGEAYKFFQNCVDHLQDILEVRPSVVAYDLHPDYLSTRWALAQEGVKTVGVQHHHAHIASCMAENHVEGRVIGFALDGTGYGTDGRIWGGEVLVADYQDFERAAHLAYVPLPGGAIAIREPWRSAVSHLWATFGSDFPKQPIPMLQQIPRFKLATLIQMIEHQVNSPLTSSCGRLFDAVAAAIDLRHDINYEGQAAIELEMCRDETFVGRPFAFDVNEVAGVLQIDPRPVFRSIVAELHRGASQGEISQRFHDGLIEVFSKIARILRERKRLNSVCLTGGTFQNAYLATEMEKKLQSMGFEVCTHSQVPAGDGGLSLGQAVIAAHRVVGKVHSAINPSP
jgi:hydrogenase maturation protein HypF